MDRRTGTKISICPGCGLQQPSLNATPESRYNSSIECWNLFGELSAYTLAHGRAGFIHQHAVDAWQAQHIVRSASNIGLAFSLMGLYLAAGRGFSGREVQLVHMQFGRTKRRWPWFDPPVNHASLTVADVLAADPGPARDAKLMDWARAVWDSWSHAHSWTRELCSAVEKPRPR